MGEEAVREANREKALRLVMACQSAIMLDLVCKLLQNT